MQFPIAFSSDLLVFQLGVGFLRDVNFKWEYIIWVKFSWRRENHKIFPIVCDHTHMFRFLKEKPICDFFLFMLGDFFITESKKYIYTPV